MGMAEEIIVEPNFEKICSDILNSDEQIRFSGFVNDKSKLIHSVQKNNLESLLSEHEIGMSIHYTLERWRKAQNFTFRLGKERLTFTEYDNVTLITVPFKGKLLLVSTEPRIAYDSIIEKINSILINWEN
ncbi:MAG TPA: DUF6659 family protein [Nitrosopumilus sp.]|jgi:hypothetical protein|nr:DUF6659 family protein [Nitrosopumilus sp.]